MTDHEDYGATTTQAEVLTALSNPSLYGGVTVQRIDTHASAIFLAGGRAIKVKRAVKFPFLDYSTLDKRKAACEAEIVVNQPSAPQIYRGVVAITKDSNGSLQIGGTGTPIEWAVDMNRFDETATLDKLADQGQFDDKLAEHLARAVVCSHRQAPAARAAPWFAALRSFIEQNDSAFRSDPNLFPLADVNALTAASLRAYEQARPLLLARGVAGFVKRLHGDLHLGNIAILNDYPVLFDAIEFDPLVATGDVLYDLAFLLMDLTERGLRPAANVVLNRYLQDAAEIAHFSALGALPLFLSLRAAIRGKVTAARRESAGPPDKTAIEASARRYFEFALEFLKPSPPTLLAIGGLSGTGKSVLARAIAPAMSLAPGAIVLRSDIERKQLFAVSEIDRLPKEAYAPDVTKRVYSSLAEKAECIIFAGHSVVVDAVFANLEERAEIAKIAADRRVTFCGLFLNADLETRLSRVSQRVGDASDADKAVVIQQNRYDIGKLDWPVVDASGRPEQTLAAAGAMLSAHFGPTASAPIHPNEPPTIRKELIQ